MKIIGSLLGGELVLIPLGINVYGIVYVMDGEDEGIIIGGYSLEGLHRLSKMLKSFYQEEKRKGGAR